MNSKLVVYGAGGHARATIDLIMSMGAFDIIGIIDDTDALLGKNVFGFPIIGNRTVLNNIKKQGCFLAANGVGGVPNINDRIQIFELFKKYKFTLPALIHSTANIEQAVQTFDGVQIFANVHIGASTILYSDCIVNSGATILSDCSIGSYSHITPGCILSENVEVGEKVLIGMGVTINPKVKIGAGSRIGNGAIILGNVPNRQIIPAGTVWYG